jgi:hypothetical protein
MPPKKTKIIVEDEKPKPKREKKTGKHKVVAIVTPDGIQGAFQSETRRPLIAHLPIHSNEIQFHDQPFTYDPKPPAAFEAFNAGDIDPFSNEATYEPTNTVTPSEEVKENREKDETITEQKSNFCKQETTIVKQMRKEYGPTSLLVQFSNTRHTHELPDHTDLACFWCCDNFPGRPCVIPIRVIDSIWNVYGNFCTPQCCMAYLLSELMDTHTRWERIALLNRLYSAQTNGRIYPAPNRECLARFGGPITIEDFRSICESQNMRVDVHMPPMVSILASMDTKPIDFYETPLRTSLPSYQPASKPDDSGILKLKRNKPLKDKESTLDVCMNMIMCG